jgi:hypothetical protein
MGVYALGVALEFDEHPAAASVETNVTLPTIRKSLSIALLTLCDDFGRKAAFGKRSDNGITF